MYTKEEAMLTIRLLLMLLLASISPAFAQAGTILDTGGGFKTFNDSTGRMGTVMDLGGGFRIYQGNRGVTGTIIDLGGGFHSFHFTQPPRPDFSSPSSSFAPAPITPFSQPGQSLGFGSPWDR